MPRSLRRRNYPAQPSCFWIEKKSWIFPSHDLFCQWIPKHVDSVFSLEGIAERSLLLYSKCGCDWSSLFPQIIQDYTFLVPVRIIGAVWTIKEKSAFGTCSGYHGKTLNLPDLRGYIETEHCITPQDWETDYHVYEGATFNLAHNWGQMIYFRPRNQFEELDHCYLVGGGTHPGSGLPTIYESGRIAANLICRARNVSFISANLHTWWSAIIRTRSMD